MATDLTASFNEQYMNINTKLKKRFMRKPNIAEATNEFNALAIQCEHSEQPSFAGHAYIGAAKCEASSGNFLGEAEYYLEGARQFMKAEMKLSSQKSYSPIRENIEASISCFMNAYNKYPEGSPIRVSILMELSNDLVILERRLEAMHYYKQALEIIDEKSTIRHTCMNNLVNLNIECGNYDMALKLTNDICDSENVNENLMIEVLVSRILLSQVVESNKYKTESLHKLIKDLLNDENNPFFSIELKLNLQSIVLSSQMKDHESLVEVCTSVGRFMTLQQQDLLTVIIKKIEGSIVT